MLTKLVLKNFRGFRDHTVPFQRKVIMIGRNNAGKSTIVEAMRLLSTVATRFRRLNFIEPPRDLRLPDTTFCVAPSLSGMNIDLKHVCHQYGDPPAVIEAHFGGKGQITVYATPDNEIYGVIRDAKGAVVRTRTHARRVSIPKINVLPQVRPFLLEEHTRDESYVRGSVLTDLSPIHFRNQLYLFDDYFDVFKRLAEESWPGLRIMELAAETTDRGVLLSLLIRDGPFVAEVGRMGHGLQIWLQAIWFLARSEPHETIILDEPDVYLHADLQRRLVRLLLARPNQLIMTSHAVDVLAEVEPDQILIVDKKRPSSSFATSLPAVQTIVDHLGAVHNIQLARLWSARKLLLVEGEDVYLLKCFQDTLYSLSDSPLDSLPHMSVGGWNGWNYAVGSKMLLTNAGGERITTYCVLDSDYHTEDEIAARLRDAAAREIQLHVWQRKEIENYLLVPGAIARALWRPGRRRIEADEIQRRIEDIAEGLKSEIVDAVAEVRSQKNRRVGIPYLMQEARRTVEDHWGSFEAKGIILPGKRVLTMLFERIQNEFGWSVTAGRIARSLKPEEIPREIKDVLATIEFGGLFRVSQTKEH